MQIPRSVKAALPLAYSYFKTHPESEIFAKPKPGHEPVRGKPKRTARDKETGAIIETPQDAVKAKQSRGGRISTTGRAGDLTMIVGPILAAAENQPELYKHWLRFAYDDDCPAAVELFVWRQLYTAWIVMPTRARQVNQDAFNNDKYAQLVTVAMLEMKSRQSNGRRRFTNAEKCEVLGLKTEERKNWLRSWEPHENDMLNILNLWDKIAKAPVAKVLYALRERNCIEIQ